MYSVAPKVYEANKKKKTEKGDAKKNKPVSTQKWFVQEPAQWQQQKGEIVFLKLCFFLSHKHAVALGEGIGDGLVSTVGIVCYSSSSYDWSIVYYGRWLFMLL